MPLMNPFLAMTIADIYQRGGAIIPDHLPAGAANATATGTGTSAANITTSYAIPSGVSELLAISPAIAPTAAAAADSVFAFMDITGNSFKRTPCQLPFPVGSVTLSAGQTAMTQQEWFETRFPVIEGDTYSWRVTPYVANAHNMKASVDLLYSTIPTRKKPIYSQMSTATQAFKSAGANTTDSITLTAADELVELATILSPETAVVAQENQILTTSVTSASLAPFQTVNYPVETAAVAISTTASVGTDNFARIPMYGSRFTTANPILQFSETLDVATTNNLNVAHLIRYTSRMM